MVGASACRVKQIRLVAQHSRKSSNPSGRCVTLDWEVAWGLGLSYDQMALRVDRIVSFHRRDSRCMPRGSAGIAGALVAVLAQDVDRAALF